MGRYHSAFAVSLLSLLALTACITLTHCSDDPVKPPPHVTTTFLEVAGTDYTTVTLKPKSTETRENGVYRITRNGVQVWEGILLAADTLITDTGLTASSDYRYQALALEGVNVFDSSAVVTAHTKDTSSGDFTWDVIELGAYPSYLRDVWMISPTDVWAVGKVTFYPSPNNEMVYNALHWDGVKWDTLQVPTTFTYSDGQQYHRNNEEMFAVYCAHPNDVWFLGLDFPGVCRWQNGVWFEMQPKWGDGPGGSINGVWGANDNLVFASTGGGIRVWNGTNFYRIKSKTELGGVTAQDVWGVDDTTLVIVGDDKYNNDTRIYRVFDGTATLFSSDSMRRGMVTLWFLRTDLIFAGGSQLSTYRNGKWNNYGVVQSWGFINHIRGQAENDVFAVGYYSTVLHYSGLMWQSYSEIDPERKYDFFAVTYNGNDIFAVGRTANMQAVILHGRRK